MDERAKRLVDAEHYAWATRALTILQDLDRCEHGRHASDSCLMCARLHDDWPEDARQQSRGNPHVRPGIVIGYDHGGNFIIMPPADRRADPRNWIVRRDG
jgi:hypothetical protein